MTEGGAEKPPVWPVPKFYFTVVFGEVEMRFQEVSGLDTEPEVIEYRAGNSKVFPNVKMPGLAKFGNVTMKKGIAPRDADIWDWFKDTMLGRAKTRTVTITLMDQVGQPAMVWTLSNAWPTKIGGTDPKSDGSEMAIETIEMAYEHLTIDPG